MNDRHIIQKVKLRMYAYVLEMHTGLSYIATRDVVCALNHNEREEKQKKNLRTFDCVIILSSMLSGCCRASPTHFICILRHYDAIFRNVEQTPIGSSQGDSMNQPNSTRKVQFEKSRRFERISDEQSQENWFLLPESKWEKFAATASSRFRHIFITSSSSHTFTHTDAAT